MFVSNAPLSREANKRYVELLDAHFEAKHDLEKTHRALEEAQARVNHLEQAIQDAWWFDD